MIQTSYHLNGDEGFTIARTQHVGPIIDAATEARNTGQAGRNGWTHIASIPAVLIEHWLSTQGKTLADWVGDGDLRKKFLNDPAHADTRIFTGTV